jgi:xylose dehydrogenase (NAD/NADP)
MATLSKDLPMTSSLPVPLRIGVLGAAKIARAFIAGVHGSPKITVAAVASRDPARAQVYAQETGVPQVHATYDALLADPAIEAIYNPLPNKLHAEWSIRALDAGKHVLCEKPLATSGAEARAMFAAAQRNGVYLAEAYPYRAQPQTQKLALLLQAGAIGRVKLIHAAFGFPMQDTANIRFNAALAGGALMDAGCYPVSFARLVAGERPRRVQAVAQWTETGVDRTLIASLEFPGGVLAQIACSFATARHRHAYIAGDGGTLVTTYLNDTSDALPPVLEIRRGIALDAPRETIATAPAAGFLAEAESFHDLVRHGWSQWSGVTPAESIDIAVTMEALAMSAREGRAIEVAAD